MTKSLSVTQVHDLICRLNLSAFHPHAFPLADRRKEFDAINDAINDLYDRSAFDSAFYNYFLDLALNAYVKGGLQ